MLADFPTHTPLKDITNQLMLCDGEINLPKWILNKTQFHNQPDYEKKTLIRKTKATIHYACRMLWKLCVIIKIKTMDQWIHLVDALHYYCYKVSTRH
jgi:hypothetical protein